MVIQGGNTLAQHNSSVMIYATIAYWSPCSCLDVCVNVWPPWMSVQSQVNLTLCIPYYRYNQHSTVCSSLSVYPGSNNTLWNISLLYTMCAVACCAHKLCTDWAIRVDWIVRIRHIWVRDSRRLRSVRKGWTSSRRFSVIYKKITGLLFFPHTYFITHL